MYILSQTTLIAVLRTGLCGSENSDASFVIFAEVSVYIVRPSVLRFNNLKTHKTKAGAKILYIGEFITWSNQKPVLVQWSTWPSWALNMSWRYCHVIMISGFLFWQVSIERDMGFQYQRCTLQTKTVWLGVSWSMAAMLSDVVVVRCHRRSAHAHAHAHDRAIHFAGHIERDKRILMIFYFYEYVLLCSHSHGSRLGSPLERPSSALKIAMRIAI